MPLSAPPWFARHPLSVLIGRPRNGALSMPVRPTRGARLRINPQRPSWVELRRAAAAIRAGEVIAAPTDTVYGLTANPFHAGAVKRLFAIKGRPESNPILLLIDSREQLGLVAGDLPESFGRIAARFWPGPLTIVVPASAAAPSAITAGTGTVAVRLPASRIARSLIRAARCPLTGTSANVSGRPAATTAREVQLQLGKRVYYIVDGGRSRGRQLSTILDLTGPPRILRRGAVSWTQLEKHL